MIAAAASADSWNSVQLTTLVVAALSPVVAAVGLILVSRTSRRQEHAQWGGHTVVAHRVDLFIQLSPRLNELLCFATFIGSWKEMEPRKAIEIKYDLDTHMYAYKALFSDELFTAYDHFIATLFETFTTAGTDAKIRAPIEGKFGSRRNLRWWNDAMSDMFTDDPVGRDHIVAAYDALYMKFRQDMAIATEVLPLRSGT